MGQRRLQSSMHLRFQRDPLAEMMGQKKQAPALPPPQDQKRGQKLEMAAMSMYQQGPQKQRHQ